jgi:hypothetical protein
MDTTTLISLTGNFLKTLGEVVADLKRKELARIDLALLNLTRTQLSEKLSDFTAGLEAAVKHEKAVAQQDLVSRGLANSTVRDSRLRAIEQDASTELEKATREYNRAIEEIALLEQQVNENARPWWKRLVR